MMSFISSSPYLIRLQELKQWQGNYDNILQKSRSQDVTSCSDSDASVNNDSKLVPVPHNTEMDWDQKPITPTKPFFELLEENLAKDQPSETSVKTKKPYLRKGSGLARFNLKPKSEINPPKQKPRLIIPNPNKLCSTEGLELDRQEQAENELIPLKAPDVSIKCLATWSKVTEHGNEFESLNNSVNIGRINEFKLNKLFSSSTHGQKYEVEEANQSEKDLHLFELLEEKVEHSSFSSNNSSIRKLLASTPKKNKVPVGNSQKMHSEILTTILQNLKLFSEKKSDGIIADNPPKKSSSSTSLSDADGDGEIWSKNSDNPQTLSSFYTEFEDTLEKPETRDICVNTSFVDNCERLPVQSNHCSGCIELTKKVEKLEKEASNITGEKAKLCDFAQELERKRDQLNEAMENLKKSHAKDLEDLREELETERLKFARDRALLDTYLKGQRPSKNERDQIEVLKKELIDLKELMKLKDTKNGTTHARLRNQIKQLEKEKLEIKTLLENLQKENSKLNASNKVNRNVETKMLQEINRNLHRLTEETKQLNKSEAPLNKENNQDKHHKKLRRKSMGDLRDKKCERELQIQLNKTSNVCTGPLQNSLENDKVSLPLELLYNNNNNLISDLEKRYESTFGLHTEDGDHNKTNYDLKQDITVTSQRKLTDGSQEIKYSNGAIKMISPDRNCIYLKYPNGDLVETNVIKNIRKAYFMERDVWITKHVDGTELVEFPNGQKEKTYPDGKVEITTADARHLTKYPDGTQEIKYPDGSKMVISKNEKIIYLPNGQRETHNNEFKKREYPDGTVKILYPDGTQESRYANGRVRIKDPYGNLMLDSQAYKT